MQYAGFWVRFVASFIDGIIVNIAISILGFVAGLVIGLLGGSGEGAQLLATGIGGLIGVLVSWLYSALMESSASQATLGKQAMGLVVTDVSGQPLSFAKASGRHFGKYLSALILMIGFIMAAFTEKKQALHDMLAGTLVVKK